MSDSKISCPNCGFEFDVEAVLSEQAAGRVRREMEREYATRFKTLESQQEQIKKKEAEFEEKRKRQNELFQERLEKELEQSKKSLTGELEKELREQFGEQIQSLEEEVKKRKDENSELRKKEIELLKREQALAEKKDEMELANQKYLLEKRKEIEAAAVEKKSTEMEMMKREYDKKLEDQVKLVEEMQKKAAQGSMQLQGEVQELAIEEWLTDQFPLDSVEEIKKGQRGGDCYQVVNSRTKTNCGIIYYESKRTKHFKQDWISKLKDDMTSIGADIGVIVTEAMPDDMERMGLRDGVWVCSFPEFKGLSFVLRETIIRISRERSAEENKGDKMVMLYDFLTSSEFRFQIESIVDAFVQMQSDLETEKRSMQRIWKSREKQIQRVILNTNHFYASIKGIAGNAISAIPALELPGGTEEIEGD